MAKRLNTTAEVIEALGGIHAVANMTDRGYTAVHNWKQWGAFPASTFLMMNGMLERLGYIADENLWRMDRIARYR